MKHILMLSGAVIVMGSALFGCSHTADGAAQDTQQDSVAVQKAADQAADATKKAAINAEDATKKATANMADSTEKAAKNADAALSVTPKVKLAISSDSELNDTHNTVNVDSADNVVHLRGTVYSDHLKRKAENIAKKALQDANATDTVSNELKVVNQ